MTQLHREIKVFNNKDFPSYLPKLNALYGDLFSSGKGFRSKLIQLISKSLKLPPSQVQLLAQTIEFIHNASLLHDDLIDRSHLRRSKPAAWLKYSPEYAVLAGDYLLARVMVNLSRHGNLKLIQYTAEIISDLLEGEWIQDSLVKDCNVRLDQLDQVHNLKTASLFKWCLRAPFICGKYFEQDLHVRLEEMGGILGILFQRSDDLLDFDIRNFESKAILGDLKSGYINSFASFLIADLAPQTKQNFIKCKTLSEVNQTIGPKYFSQKLEEFDNLNQKHIDLYEHHLKHLEVSLPSQCSELVYDLEKLPRPIYWREKRNGS